MIYEQIYAIGLSDFEDTMHTLRELGLDYYVSSIVVSKGTEAYHIKDCNDSKINILPGQLCVLFNCEYHCELPTLKLSENYYIAPLWVDENFCQTYIGTDINSLSVSYKQVLLWQIEDCIDNFKVSLNFCVEDENDELTYYDSVENLYDDLNSAFKIALVKYRRQNSKIGGLKNDSRHYIFD